MKPKQELIALSSVLKKNFSKYYLQSSDFYITVQIWKKWSELASNHLVQKASPVNYKQGRLTLWAEHPTVMQEIYFHIEKLKQKINSHFKKNLVQEVYFTSDKNIIENRKHTISFIEKVL